MSRFYSPQASICASGDLEPEEEMGNPWVVQELLAALLLSRVFWSLKMIQSWPQAWHCARLICLRKCLIRRGKKVFGKTGLCSVNCGALRAASGAEVQAEAWMREVTN